MKAAATFLSVYTFPACENEIHRRACSNNSHRPPLYFVVARAAVFFEGARVASSFASALRGDMFASPIFWQIRYLVTNLTKKNLKSSISELNQVFLIRLPVYAWSVLYDVPRSVALGTRLAIPDETAVPPACCMETLPLFCSDSYRGDS